MKKVFCGRDLSLKLKIRLVRCYVLSVLFYGMEAWTLKKIDTKRIEALEMWMYRRILRIPEYLWRFCEECGKRKN